MEKAFLLTRQFDLCCSAKCHLLLIPRSLPPTPLNAAIFQRSKSFTSTTAAGRTAAPSTKTRPTIDRSCCWSFGCSSPAQRQLRNSFRANGSCRRQCRGNGWLHTGVHLGVWPDRVATVVVFSVHSLILDYV